MKILVSFGTRPEIIKLAPVLKELSQDKSRFRIVTVSTGQHRRMADQLLRSFGISPDHDLNVMKPSQTLSDITAEVLLRMEPILSQERPDLVMVQGDTSSALSMALAAFYHRIPVAHVEAGLRSKDLHNPFPEEMNRVLISRLASYHFPPTQAARANLLEEGFEDNRIRVTGNTVVDALFLALREPDTQGLAGLASLLDWKGRTLLMTLHRRETWGEPLRRICEAVKRVAADFHDLQVVFPVHLNPAVREAAHASLSGRERVHLIDPLEYHTFVSLMKASTLILTDSGGIQEEAPSLGKPVVLARDLTDRPESASSGIALICGTGEDGVETALRKLLSDRGAFESMISSSNPYGDGKASSRIAESLAAWFSLK